MLTKRIRHKAYARAETAITVKKGDLRPFIPSFLARITGPAVDAVLLFNGPDSPAAEEDSLATLVLGVSFCLRVSTVYALHGSGDQLIEWRARQNEEANPSGKTKYIGCTATTKSEGSSQF